jgi:hypothetical protein
VWQDRPSTPLRVRWRARWQQWSYGNALQRAEFRRRLLNKNPFFWLAARDRLKPTYVWGVLGVIGAFWLWGFLYESEVWREAGTYVTTSIFLHGTLKFWMGGVVVQRLAEDRRSAALELLLSTPLTTTEIFRGQLRAILRQFGGPLAAVLVADVLLCHSGLRDLYTDRDVYLATFISGMIVLVADAYTIVWLGQWIAVTAKQPNHAASATLVRVLVFPWLAFMALVTVYSVLELQRRWGLDFSEGQALAIWFVLAIVNDIFFLRYARRRLRTRFRDVATQRFAGERKGWLRRLLGDS